MKKIWAYILPTALCFVLGGLAGWLQQDAIEEWYPLLDKPTLTPPNAVFPIAWSIIYLCMGISGGLVLTSEAPARKSAVRLWFLQLGCNFLWSILFFVCRSRSPLHILKCPSVLSLMMNGRKEKLKRI